MADDHGPEPAPFCFLLLRSAYSSNAQAAATSEFYRTAPTSHGGSAVGVPGQVRGLAALHARHGRVRWAEVVRPSVELARGGMSMGRDLYDVSCGVVCGVWHGVVCGVGGCIVCRSALCWFLRC
jgi:hypothetical protein